MRSQRSRQARGHDQLLDPPFAAVARLVDRLATPDIDGRSLLDNTLVVGLQLGNGWHGYQNYLLIFGGGWSFRTGRYVYLPHETPVRMWSRVHRRGWVPRPGRPHQHLLVSAAQAMGVDANVVGIASVRGKSGEHVGAQDRWKNLVNERQGC